MGELILCVDDNDVVSTSSSSSYSVAADLCRICHEGEFESRQSLETPCACSGTIKFAHRDCIMRWCNEKGNAICEICLQKFEPGYVALPKKELSIDSPPVTLIRVSVEIPRNQELENGMAEEEAEETPYSECSSTLDTSVSYCRSVALIFTILLLMRHTLALLCEGTADYPFTLLTLLTLRAAGILLPMFVLTWIFTAIQNTVNRHQYQVSDHHIIPTSGEDNNVNHQQQQQQQQLPSV